MSFCPTSQPWPLGFLGCCKMAKDNCTIYVQTGDQKGASTDANIFIILYDKQNVSSPEYKLDNFLWNDFESGSIDKFQVELPDDFGEVSMIEVWRDDFGISADWYIDLIKVEQSDPKKTSIFPVFRWIKADNGSGQKHLRIVELDTNLPQYDPNRAQRKKEIEHIRTIYRLKYIPGMPITSEELPTDEQFSPSYKSHLSYTKLTNTLLNLYAKVSVREWDSFDDFDDIYDWIRTKPLAADNWKEDVWFANQRLIGCNPTLITLCTKIPEKLGVDEKMMEPILNGETLASLIDKKRLFYTDLAVLDGIIHNEEFEICAPIALFMLDDKNHLLPIAIQLNQEKGPENPVFLPTDDYYVWLMAKLWYNNADASFHQSVFHLGWTHLQMEGVILAIHRNISVSHPIFKLMAPHTLFLLAINARGVSKLLSNGGWVDITMSIGTKGLNALISRCHSKWRFDLQGTPPAEFKSRNVEDPNVLPNYYYRDDSLRIYNVIFTYVKNYVKLYYDNDQVLLNDWEIQNWAEHLAEEKSKGGIGLAGVPETDGKGGFNTVEELIMVLTSILYICSAGHAAANFQQYAEYGFPANYPSQIRGKLINDKNPRTEKDILQSLPDQNTTLDVMSITHLVSEKATQSLGDFETQYIYDPKALKVVDKFRADLKAVSIEINARNSKLKIPYEVLLPENIPNSISI